MADFRYQVSADCFIGQDSIYKIPLLLEGGPDRAILINDPDLNDSKLNEKLITVLEGRGIKLISFDDVGEKPSSASVENALSITKGARAPLVIGLGGIKTMHIAKAVAALGNDDTSIDDWIDGKTPLHQSLPLVLVPTSYRDAFLLSGGLVLSDARNKRAVFLQAQKGIESALILDPNAFSGLSTKAAAASILDGIMASIEGYVSSKDNFMSDMVLHEAIGYYVKAFDIALQRPDDPEVRILASKACFLSSIGLATSSPGLGTAIAYAINARWGIPKANISAVILPYLVESFVRSRPDKIAAMAPLFCEIEASEGASGAATRAIESIRTRLGLLKIPSRLNDFELPLEKLVETSESARRFDFMNFLARTMTVDDIFDFIKTVY